MDSLSRSSSFDSSSSSYSSLRVECESTEIDEKIKAVVHLDPLQRVTKKSGRSHSFSHFSLKRQFKKARSKSEGSLVESKGEKKITKKFHDLFHKPLKQENSEESEGSFLDEVLSQKFNILVVGSRDSLTLTDEPLEQFHWGSLNLEFTQSVQKLLLNFVDVEHVKKEACEKSEQILRAWKFLSKEKMKCKENLKKAESDFTREDEKARLKKAKEDSKRLKAERGVPILCQKGVTLDVQQLNLVDDPQLNIDPISEPGVILIKYECIFAIPASKQRYLFRKTGSIAKGALDLYFLKTQYYLEHAPSN